MSPPIPVSDLPPPLSEYHYIINEQGKPEVIYIPPSSEDQFHDLPLYDHQLDFLEQIIENAEVKNVAVSLNKTRRKLFRENGLLKKRIAALEMQNDEIRLEIDHLYEILNLNLKKGK